MDRVHVAKTILWTITGLAAAVAITRYFFGLGVTTNLTDATPWGFWIGFDVMGGVALAGGGFVITAIVYMIKREEFHPIVKPAVLTAFLGYLAVIVSLLVDLGLPWNIWHMLIYWNLHSPLFEVGWCVMLYTTVLALEFSPVPLEKASRYARIRNFLMKFRFPLVLLGIMLSTLHQSSLGSLFLIMPFKLPELWYTGMLPVLFFISAVALGLGMVSLESLVSTYLYRRKPETKLIAKLGKAAVWVLVVYFVVRMGDLLAAGEFTDMFNGRWESNLFLLELLISVILPVVIFSVPTLRNRAGWQFVGSLLIVVGIVFNRLNVGGLTMLRATGDTYVPSWMELTVSAGVVSGAILVFFFVLEKFNIWERPPKDPEDAPDAPPQFDRSTQVWLGAPAVAGRTKYSLAFILALAAGFALIPGKDLSSVGIEQVPAQQARGGDTLWVAGNRDGYGVAFKHEFHVSKLGEKESCVLCHHMNMPQDKQSGCYHCHRNMYDTSDAARHEWHGSPSGANIACMDCHTPGKERTAESAKTCNQCHRDLFPPGSTINVVQYSAPSYVDAMHGLCVDCHEKTAGDTPTRPDLALCTTCHETSAPQYMQAEFESGRLRPQYNRVLLPGKRRTAEDTQ
jgi:Ni/Fe-hydrogenase subunit HybB-like protein